MQLKTILNRVQKRRSFVYRLAQLVQRPRLTNEVQVRSRAGSRARHLGHGALAAGYDTLPERQFEFEPLWGIAVFLRYATRRVSCAQSGVGWRRFRGRLASSS